MSHLSLSVVAVSFVQTARPLAKLRINPNRLGWSFLTGTTRGGMSRVLEPLR